ncbi:reverse transcriptase family protein [Yersinia proxima]|uniref:reverse transcriptase family protein n=1 Tax=Yersinia proxima TaxID=2890316 RepID=UPI001D125512|nr:reverse transcriptase family protein [Yersinia proxima]
MDKPNYPHKPISEVSVLAKTLGISEVMLKSIASKVDTSYTEFDIDSNGKDRHVYEPKFNLKKLQKRINSRIFEQVNFPSYLHGGIRDVNIRRDYVENARLHSKTKVNSLINLDIKSFYDNIKRDKVYNIYKYFFRFTDPVCEILTILTTYKNKVPQGACTSSYLANLVFYNSEYQVVSALRCKGITYTRLLDDVTLSSKKILSETTISNSIKSVISMFTKHGLKQNKKKMKIESIQNKKDGFQVTGLWVGHAEPKTRRDERRYIRLMVYVCEKEYLNSMSTESYHELWNKTSGLVAKLNRLNQSNYKSLRERLGAVLPLYNDSERDKIIRECKSLLKLDSSKPVSYGQLDSINKIYSRLGILARNNTNLSRSWRKKLKSHFRKLPTKKEIWL